MTVTSVRQLVCTILLASACYRGTTSLDEAERKLDAAWLGMRLADPVDGPGAAEALVRLAAHHAEAHAVLADRLATMRPGSVRDRLDALVRTHAGEAETAAFLASLAGDPRPPFRDAAARVTSAR